MSFAGSFTGGGQIGPPAIPLPSKIESEPLIRAVTDQTIVRESRVNNIGDNAMSQVDLAAAIHQAFPALNHSQIGAAIGYVRNLSDSASENSDVTRKFQTLADEWHQATAAWSSAIKIANHPAYQKIIGMGEKALPLILKHLQETRANWLWALYAITCEQPAPTGSNYGEAVDAWLEWGRNKGYL